MSGLKAAIKIYDKYKLNDTHKKQSVKRETSLLQRIVHPNIIKLVEIFDCPKQVI